MDFSHVFDTDVPALMTISLPLDFLRLCFYFHGILIHDE